MFYVCILLSRRELKEKKLTERASKFKTQKERINFVDRMQVYYAEYCLTKIQPSAVNNFVRQLQSRELKYEDYMDVFALTDDSNME